MANSGVNTNGSQVSRFVSKLFGSTFISPVSLMPASIVLSLYRGNSMAQRQTRGVWQSDFWHGCHLCH